jgi:Fe-S-cluster containining protein
MQSINRSYQSAAGVNVDEFSLLNICRACKGRCCVGRTMATSEERRTVAEFSGSDHFVLWREDLWYLDRGVCPYLKGGLCSVQEVKPFACQIFPFVPRIIDGQLWLYCVGECDAGSHLPEGFTEKAIKLARAFFEGVSLGKYEEYWNENKIGDFDEERVQFRVRVVGRQEDETVR